MVLASATVDKIRASTPKKHGLFTVTVWGQPPHDETRIYEIPASCETKAAQQGNSRFVREMEDTSTKES